MDGDWCRDADPFQVTEETKTMVLENICFLLNQFINCSAYDNIIFCWVMHMQSIIDAIVNQLQKENYDVKVISLICNAETLKTRLQKDIDQGIRTSDVLERSLARIGLYQNLNTTKIVTDGKCTDEIVNEIIEL